MIVTINNAYLWDIKCKIGRNPYSDYIKAPDATRPQETLFVPDETLVDLYDYSLSIDSLQPQEESQEVAADTSGLSCEAAWVAVEGNPVDHG